MSQLTTANIALKQAVFVGSDVDLKEAVRVAILSKYTLEMMEEVPHIWPDSIDLVLIEYNGSDDNIFEKINLILTLSKGVPIYALLKNKDVDFIIEASHQGVQGFIECPNEIFHILSILHMQERRSKGKNGNVSTFFSLKGGVGCTAIATNVAATISKITEGRSVIVDLNMPLGDISLYLNMEGDRLYTITDFIYNLNRFDENLIYKSLSRHSSGLYLLPLPFDIGELETLNSELITKIIGLLRKYFDHVIIDCSSDLSDVTLSCLDESDNVVLVCEPSLSSLRAVNSVIKLTQRLGYAKDSIKLIVNRNLLEQDEMIEEVISLIEVDSVSRVNNDYITFNESLKEGRIIEEYNNKTKVYFQMKGIAKMLHNGSLNIETAALASENPAGSFLAKIKTRALNKLIKNPENSSVTKEDAKWG